MTLIIINKTNQGYSTSIQDRVAVINNEPVKSNSKVIKHYLRRLVGKELSC